MLSPCMLPMRLLQRPAAFTMLRAASQGVPGLHISLQPIGVRTFSKKVPTTPSNRPKLIGNNDHITPRNPDEVPSDVLYEYKRNSYFTMLSAGSLLQIAFWSWLKGTEASLPVVVPPPSAASAALDPSFLSIVTNEAWSSVGLGSSVIMALVVVFFSQRSIARISVISGGGKLRLTTHKFLGGLSAPLDHPVAQLRAAAVTDKYISVKVGDEPGYYLIDVNGEFFNRARLDQLLKINQNRPSPPSSTPSSPPKEPFRAPIRSDLPRTNLKK
ncbi:hypothetical protein LEN26_006526 [Aphanomyces euteiches]|nr:hypothetical protein AeMF1_004638 [Aphanomyces euteiches]KAH9135219.1 hypothetical protein LEN26_006526 [Aphanomyces euteiches]KAH9185399.1 hypothetical protein AeNC1_012627 [Aphanomyces euteiches]